MGIVLKSTKPFLLIFNHALGRIVPISLSVIMAVVNNRLGGAK
jgi:hypothetical protein